MQNKKEISGFQNIFREETLMQIFSEQKITVKQKEEHSNMLVGSDLLDNLHKIPFFGKQQFSSFLVITDETVYKIYGSTLLTSLRKLNLPVSVSIIPSGEKSKNFENAGKFLKPFFQSALTRESCFISLGGGVITDIGGFFASILLRGIPAIHIPTTLLGQIDASLGGKSGMDFWVSESLMYKNMIGKIKQPDLILCDVTTLFSLPESEIKNGLGEMVKYWVGWNRPSLSDLEKIRNLKSQDTQTIAEIIANCQKIKLDIVKNDPFETKGERQKLNFGHTIGHALEGAAAGKLSHGEAVSIGVVAAAKLSHYLGILDKKTSQHIGKTIASLGLPTTAPRLSIKNIFSALSLDKKSGTFVIIHNIGKLETGVRVDTTLVRRVLAEIML